MTTFAPESVRDLEEILRGNGITLTPAPEVREDISDLQTADGRFKVAPARVVNRQENLVTLYRTDTGEAIPTDVNEALRRLKKRYPIRGDFAASYPQLAGRYAFSLGVQVSGRYVAPTPLLHQDAVVGELCWLNPISEQFAWTRALGVRSVCRSTAKRTPLETRSHIQSKHTGVWPLVEEDRVRKQRDEEREERQTSQDRMLALVEMVLKQRGIDTAQAPEIVKAVERQVTAVTCPQCGKTYTGGFGTRNLKSHMKKEHREE